MRHNARDRICSEACMGLSCFPRIHHPVHSQPGPEDCGREDEPPGTAVRVLAYEK